MELHLEFEQGEDGRSIAEVTDLPGVLAYGSTLEEVRVRVQALALRVAADRIEEENLSVSEVRFAA